MLTHTYIHLAGVGPRTEAHFWRQGRGTWEDFLHADRISGLSRERVRRLQEQVRESLEEVANAGYFAARLQPGEHWRLFRHFRPRAAYLDIETTGPFWPGLTGTGGGLYGGQGRRQFVHGYN